MDAENTAILDIATRYPEVQHRHGKGNIHRFTRDLKCDGSVYVVARADCYHIQLTGAADALLRPVLTTVLGECDGSERDHPYWKVAYIETVDWVVHTFDLYLDKRVG